MTTPHKPTAPRGWRVVSRDDVVMRGDRWWDTDDNTWNKATVCFGHQVTLIYIRRKKASRNGKLPLAVKTRKIPTPSGVTKKGRKEEAVWWIWVFKDRIGFSGTSPEERKSASDYYGKPIAQIPITQSMLKRWRTK